MRWIVLLGITTIGVLSGVPSTRAQSFDGTYAGTLACPALPGGAPLRTPFMLTVSGGRASHEREIRSPGAAGGQTGSYERGGGTVSPAGDVSLRGACQDSFTCDAEYRGQLTGGPIRLTGTQRWRTRERDVSRDCEIELASKP
jgi:hypothetical protein